MYRTRIGVLKNFIKLTEENKKRIPIITNENIYQLRLANSPIPRGVYYTLTENGMGLPISRPEDVQPGDFVQFRTVTWGHCGIVKSIDIANKTMELYISFPSTGGYGIQTFDIALIKNA